MSRFHAISIVTLVLACLCINAPARLVADEASAGDDLPPKPPKPVATSPVEAPDKDTAASEEDTEAPENVASYHDCEIVTVRYPNRAVKIEKSVKQDEKHNYFDHGPWAMWDEEGQMLGAGVNENGKRHGKWTRWHVDGAPEQLNSDAFGDFKQPFVSEATYREGKLHGTWTILDARDRMVCSMKFEDGKLHGGLTWWYADGRKQREMTYRDGVLEGDWLEWSPEEKLVKKIAHIGGRKLAPFVKRFATGEKQVEGWYLQAKDVARTRYNWWLGSIVTENVGTEGTNQKHGHWIHWSRDGGKIYEGDFDDGQAAGKHIWWYANGQKRIEGAFEDGKEHGTWTWWHETGLKQLTGKFDHGRQVGDWISWNEDGRVRDVQRLATAGEKRTESAEEVLKRIMQSRNDGTAQRRATVPRKTSRYNYRSRRPLR